MNKVSICIISMETLTGEPYVLKIDNDLPQIVLDGQILKELKLFVNNMLKKYINLDSNWIPIKLLNVYMEDNNTDVNIVYVGQVPFETKLLNGAIFEKAWTNQSQIVLEAIQSL